MSKNLKTLVWFTSCAKPFRHGISASTALAGLVFFLGCSEVERPTSSVEMSTYAAKPATPSGCVPPPVGMVSWWPGDGNLDDIIDANNPSAQSGVSFVPGKVGQGITIAPEGFIDITDNANLKPLTFTIDAWVQPKAPSTNPDIFGDIIFQKARSFTAPQTSYNLSWSSVDNKFHVLLGHTLGDQGHQASTGTYAPDQFYHVALTYDATTLKLYVDGVLDFSVAIGKPILYSTVQAVIGANAKIYRDGGFFFRSWQGVIDELEFFSRALSVEEIRAIFNAGSAGKCIDPLTKDDCKKGGWKKHGFKNQGQCVRFIETGKDSR